MTNSVDTFSLDILKKALEETSFSKNVTTSPSSIYLNLMLVRAVYGNFFGSELSFLDDHEFSRLLKEFEKGENAEEISLNLRNIFSKIVCDGEVSTRIYTSNEANSTFEDLLSNTLSVDIEKISFSIPAQASKIMNSWVSSATKRKVTGLVKPENISSDTVLILLTVARLKPIWKVGFGEKETKNESFYAKDKVSSVQMMHQQGLHGYYQSVAKKYSVLIKDFSSSGVVGLFVLPDRDSDLNKLLQNLTFKEIENSLSLAHNVTVVAGIPKCSLVTQIAIKELLTKMGLTALLEQKTGREKKAGSKSMPIYEILHSSSITFEEQNDGASVPLGVCTKKADPASQKIIYFTANRPFLFLVYEKMSMSILFINVILDPTSD